MIIMALFKKKAKEEPVVVQETKPVEDKENKVSNAAVLVMEAVYKNKKKEFVNFYMLYKGEKPTLRDLQGAQAAQLSKMKSEEDTAGVEKLTIVNLIPYSL